MADKIEAVAGEVKVELSRLYPIDGAETNEVTDTKTGKKKKVTVLRLKELNGYDNVAMSKEIENGKLAGYLQISASAGITYEEALSLFDTDSSKVAEAIQGF